jgi:hypothetical protein
MAKLLDYLPDAPATKAKPGKILIHNVVPDHEQQQVGTRGLRVWQDDRAAASEYVRCYCGWRPDLGPHFTTRVAPGKVRKS